MIAFFAGAAVGTVVTFVVFAAFMAPKHWDWYQQNKELQVALVHRTSERDHYKNLISPIQWGTQEEHEARTVKTQKVYPDAETGDVHFRFDDILHGGD